MADRFSSLSSVAPTAPTTQVGEIRFHPEATPKSGAAPAAAIGRAGGHLEEPTCPSNSVPEAPTEPQRPLKRKATGAAPLAGRSWGSGGTELGAELGGQVLLRDHAEQPRTKPWHRALDETETDRCEVLHPKGWEATEAGTSHGRSAALNGTNGGFGWVSGGPGGRRTWCYSWACCWVLVLAGGSCCFQGSC